MDSSRSPLELTIEKCVHGGSGLARSEHGVVLVDGVVPGEKVKVAFMEKRAGMQYAALQDIITPSPFRRTPACRYFGVCGGCDWLFMSYERQVQCKKQIFSEAMARIGKVTAFPEPGLHVASEFGYRCRAQIKFDAERAIAGFFRAASNEVVGIDYCPLLTDRLNLLLKRFAANPSLLPPGCTSCKVIDGDDGIASSPVINGVTCQTTTVRCGGFSFDVDGGDFVQSNRLLLADLAEWVRQRCSGGTLVDLYGGAGFFSMACAARCSRGWLIEADKGMVARAVQNFEKNDIASISAIAASAEKFGKFVPRSPDVLIVDPPRPGLSREVREAIVACKPATVVYVSCDCATQARDAGYFVKNGGYRISAMALFDLYPNTHHTETVITFERG